MPPPPRRPRPRTTASASASGCGRKRNSTTAAPITAEDVVFSLTTLKTKGHPNIRATLRDLDVIEAEDARTLRLVFNPRRGRDAVLNAAVQPILSRAYYASAPVRGEHAGAAAGLGALSRRQVRAGPLHGVRARQGLVGRRSAALPRPVQFRRHPLRILPRPRHRVRGLHRRQLSVPRGVHLARLGDALRRAGGARRPHQARRSPRRAAVRHARLDVQHPQGPVPGSARCARRSRWRSTSNGPTPT